MSRPAARTSSAAPHCPVTETRGGPVPEETLFALVVQHEARDVPGRLCYTKPGTGPLRQALAEHGYRVMTVTERVPQGRDG